jgi:UDPglucose 6-dehydrogenase
MRVTVVGAGYVGLLFSAWLADFGHQVTCVDTDADKIQELAGGRAASLEPDLDVLLRRNIEAGRLSFAVRTGQDIPSADVALIAVDTPSRPVDPSMDDLSSVRDAAREIGASLDGYTVVVTKSAIPVGTADEVDAILRLVRPEADFSVVSNPDFLREGAAIEDLKEPYRIVVGTEEPRAQAVMRELYGRLFRDGTPILFTGRRSAEQLKYGANPFVATPHQ